MKVPPPLLWVTLSSLWMAATITEQVAAFSLLPSFPVHSCRVPVSLWAEETSSSSSSSTTTTTPASPPKKKKLGLLSFDLDDTLYPIAPVLESANAAFAQAMQRFGYKDIRPDDILIRSKHIRTTPEGVSLTHTDVRLLAIRQEMEKVILEKKLRDTAEDWATEVEFLSKVVVESAKKWASQAVPKSVVQAVYTAWEMERYHAAERLLYPEVMSVLQEIKEDNPEVIIGAVTDGRANPLLMTFTLAPYFDYCCSWEDDQGKRAKFFQELSQVEGEAELTWIYQASKEQYKALAETNAAVAASAAAEKDGEAPATAYKEEDYVWIHVGDDLAYDVGGSAACGAKTILVDLVEKYGQTAKLRFTGGEASWSTSSKEELENHQRLNEEARDKVDERIDRLTRLPEAIKKILEEAA